jgi:hypothetical protein
MLLVILSNLSAVGGTFKCWIRPRVAVQCVSATMVFGFGSVVQGRYGRRPACGISSAASDARLVVCLS